MMNSYEKYKICCCHVKKFILVWSILAIVFKLLFIIGAFIGIITFAKVSQIDNSVIGKLNLTITIDGKEQTFPNSNFDTKQIGNQSIILLSFVILVSIIGVVCFSLAIAAIKRIRANLLWPLIIYQIIDAILSVLAMFFNNSIYKNRGVSSGQLSLPILVPSAILTFLLKGFFLWALKRCYEYLKEAREHFGVIPGNAVPLMSRNIV